MADEIDELIMAGNLCANTGYHHAAAVLGRECAKLIREAKHPRKASVKVRLKAGGVAWLPKSKIREAEEYDE